MEKPNNFRTYLFFFSKLDVRLLSKAEGLELGMVQGTRAGVEELDPHLVLPRVGAAPREIQVG